MAIKIGDKVRFLNEVGGGIVSRVEGGKLVYVLDNEGFEIPSLITEVVLVEKQVVEKKEEGDVEVDDVADSNVEEEEEEGNPKILLAFLKRAEMPANVSLYLINDSNFFVFYTLGKVVDDKIENSFNGIIEPNTKILLNEYSINELDGVKYHADALLFRKNIQYKYRDAIKYDVKFNGAKLLKDGSYVSNEYFVEKAYLHYVLKGIVEEKIEALTNKNLNKIIKEKDGKAKTAKAKLKDDDKILEIDLHIHELLDDIRGLSNKEMLDIQMQKFYSVLEENKNKKNKKIVFIHGVGNGVLKSEIRKAMERKYKWHTFQDASFKEYGYGATMVII